MKYKRQNKSLLNGLFSFMLLSNNVEVIDLDNFDPAYLKIRDYEQDWEIFAEKVNLLYVRLEKSCLKC